ncbi:lysophospholipid acyltransferase family protein [Aquabacterium sp.]|uniref:lysophospholipid acyltransferase family protein n=1 Tax=Aquabacterium sp. TaxID=1872578 RepID=UPI0035B4392F
MRRLVLLLVFYGVLLWLGLMLLVGNVLCLPLVLAPRAWRQPFLQRMISGTFRLFLNGCALGGIMRLDLGALDALSGERGLVMVANHPSMIDVFLVVSRLRGAVCLMKSSLSNNVFLAAGAHLAGYIPNRQPELLVREAADAVARGQALVIFPEGTRTVTPPLNELKSGAALIAQRAHAPLQVIVLETNSRYLCKGWPIWRPPEFPMVYRARLSTRLPPGGSVQRTMQDLQQVWLSELPDGPYALRHPHDS